MNKAFQPLLDLESKTKAGEIAPLVAPPKAPFWPSRTHARRFDIAKAQLELRKQKGLPADARVAIVTALFGPPVPRPENAPLEPLQEACEPPLGGPGFVRADPLDSDDNAPEMCRAHRPSSFRPFVDSSSPSPAPGRDGARPSQNDQAHPGNNLSWLTCSGLLAHLRGEDSLSMVVAMLEDEIDFGFVYFAEQVEWKIGNLTSEEWEQLSAFPTVGDLADFLGKVAAEGREKVPPPKPNLWLERALWLFATLLALGMLWTIGHALARLLRIQGG